VAKSAPYSTRPLLSPVAHAAPNPHHGRVRIELEAIGGPLQVGAEDETAGGVVVELGFEPVRLEHIDPKVTPAPTGEVRHGTRGGRPDVRLLGGYFVFDSPDAALLVSLLPALVHVRGTERLSVLVRLVGDESSERRSGRDLVLTRLVEVLLIEALRSTSGEDAPPGLLRGLADAQLAPAMRQMHGQLARSWTVAQLAKTAALSRSAFFERFTRTVGLPPMEYLLAWRMAVAKDLLRRHGFGLAEVAERVGYGSASTFSTAFSRHVGQPPSRYAREQRSSGGAKEAPRGHHREVVRGPSLPAPMNTPGDNALNFPVARPRNQYPRGPTGT
jgi:AraC-like DNA-binding protein